MTDVADATPEEAAPNQAEGGAAAPAFANPVNITLNGADVTVDGDKVLIDAVEEAGEYIPRFCYHPRMSAVGMCRMCIVECDTGRGPALTPTCMIKASPDMKVDTRSEVTKAAQDGVLELFLINHPLDCPVCDKGGECPLQDQTMAYGPGESRFVEEKRHFEKPIAISDTVYLDRERCILCDRCTRFADEVAGDPLIHFMDRGNQTQVNTFPDEPFSSYFSGNTVQICPVGALTAKPYRFKARPWDLNEVTSTFPNAMGDRIAIQASRNEVLRYQGVDNDSVNWGWMSDRDRFSFEATQADTRITTPLMRGDALGNPSSAGTELVGASWPQAAGAAADAIRAALNNGGPSRIGVIGGARLTNEGQYAWARLAKGIIGTDNVDAQLADGLSPQLLFSLPRTTLDEAFAPGSTVVLLAGDPKEELGTLFLRLRHAVIRDNVKLIELTPAATGLSHLTSMTVRVRPGEIASVVAGLADGSMNNDLPDVAEALASGPFTVIAGRTSLAESPVFTEAALRSFATMDGARFLPALRRGNVAGALDMGLTPGVLPGRVTLADGATWFAQQWGQTPSTPGMGTTQMLQAAASGQLDVLILLGADPLADFPDRELAQQAMRGVGTVIAVDLFANSSVAAHASVILPAAAVGEHDGSHTNLEGRVTAVNQKVTSPGTARPDWMIAAELAWQLGNDLGFDSADGVTREIAKVSGLHAPISTDSLGAYNGVILSGDAVSGRPNPISSSAAVSAPKAPQVDAYSWRLVVDRTMYDNGTIISNCAASSHLGGPGEIRMAPADFDRLGFAAGSTVKVSSAKGQIFGPVISDPSVMRGVIAIAANHDDVDPGLLIDIDSPVTDVRVEAA